MIRRDYFMRMVQELTQALARVLFLKKTQEFPRALDEIENVLTRFWNLTPEQIRTFTLERWIEQCRQEQGPMGEKLLALADLFNEQEEMYGEEHNISESHRSGAISLGLYLEAVAQPDTVISVDLLEKIEQLLERCQGPPLPAEVSRRLLAYFETRGMLDKAENILFEWLDSGDPDAATAGLAFYDRLMTRNNEELERCGLPREEVEQGRAEVLKRATKD